MKRHWNTWERVALIVAIAAVLITALIVSGGNIHIAFGTVQR